MGFSNFIDDSIVFLTFCFVYQILPVIANDSFVCRYNHHIQIINTAQFFCLCFSRTCHSGQFIIHTKIILNRDRGQRLSFSFDLNIFLGFNSLVQTVAITAPRENTTGKFIDNEYLPILDNIFNIFLIQCLGS